jgi:hypothetical protein
MVTTKSKLIDLYENVLLSSPYSYEDILTLMNASGIALLEPDLFVPMMGSAIKAQILAEGLSDEELEQVEAVLSELGLEELKTAIAERPELSPILLGLEAVLHAALEVSEQTTLIDDEGLIALINNQIVLDHKAGICGPTPHYLGIVENG